MGRYTVKKFDYNVWGICNPSGKEIKREKVGDKSSTCRLMVNNLQVQANILNRETVALREENESAKGVIASMEQRIAELEEIIEARIENLRR